MSDRVQWLFVALFVCAVFLGAYLFAHVTKPDCPQLSEARWTRSGWYCTVPPCRGVERKC